MFFFFSPSKPFHGLWLFYYKWLHLDVSCSCRRAACCWPCTRPPMCVLWVVACRRSHIGTLLGNSSGESLPQWTVRPWLDNVVLHHFIRMVPNGFKHSSVLFSTSFFMLLSLNYQEYSTFSGFSGWWWADISPLSCCSTTGRSPVLYYVICVVIEVQLPI